MSDPTAKRRNTAATRHRMDNVRSLIKEIGVRGSMLADEICFFLGYSPSGGRKYIRQMSDVGIITWVVPKRDEPRIYTLNPDQAHIDAALAAMFVVSTSAPDTEAAPTTGRMVLESPGRHIHVMRDDVNYKIKTKFRIPEPDPLVAHLFGFAGIPV